MKGQGLKTKDFKSERIHKYLEAGIWTYTASHRLRRSQDIIIHGVIIAGKCYTHGLILPLVNSDDPIACANNCIDILKEEDPEFAQCCHEATVFNIHQHQERELQKLRDELKSVPVPYHGLPYHEMIQKNTPVNTIQQQTE